MSDSITLGTFTVTALDDGECLLPPMFYPGADFTAEPELLSSDGTYHIRAGAYLVQGPGTTMLVDAGAGPDNIPFPAEMATAAGLDTHPEFLTEVGHLPDSLAAAGVDPSDVTVIVLTHLHSDHIGWVAPHGKVFFPNAVVYYGEADWDALISPKEKDDPDRVVMEAARDAGVLRPLTAPSVSVADGVIAVHAPGHTPGSYLVTIASDGQKLYLTGDVIQHPQQLTRSGVDFLTDHDRVHATATRADLFAEVAGTNVVLGTAHVPNPVFRRVASDRKWLRADS